MAGTLCKAPRRSTPAAPPGGEAETNFPLAIVGGSAARHSHRDDESVGHVWENGDRQSVCR